MTSDKWLAERDAAQSFSELLQRADECARKHELAGMALPEPLKRLLGMMSESSAKVAQIIIPPLEWTRPHGVSSDWVSIDISNAVVTTLVLAVLRESAKPIRPKDLVARVLSLRPDISAGSIANIGTRLGGDLILRTDDGWGLADPTSAPVLRDGRVWAHPDTFQKTELASHRREAVLHLLALYPGGLQAVQMLEQLGTCEWLKAPLNKELVQGDIEVLQAERKIVRQGSSRKWTLTERED